MESLNDESWRKSVETFLGNKRYSIIVDDEYCHEALSILNEKNLYKANVILTDKIPETEIEENSASTVLNITNKMGIEELEKYSSFAKPLEENDLKKAKTLIEKAISQK